MTQCTFLLLITAEFMASHIGSKGLHLRLCMCDFQTRILNKLDHKSTAKLLRMCVFVLFFICLFVIPFLLIGFLMLHYMGSLLKLNSPGKNRKCQKNGCHAQLHNCKLCKLCAESHGSQPAHKLSCRDRLYRNCWLLFCLFVRLLACLLFCSATSGFVFFGWGGIAIPAENIDTYLEHLCFQ